MSDQKITFKIITPQKQVYESVVDEILLPTTSGPISVLARHVGMISLIKSGELIVRKDGEEIVHHVHKGILEVKPGSRVNVLADSADHINELDEEKILEAKKRVEKILEDKDNLDEVQFARVEDSLMRELSRLNTYKKYR